jgi:transcriptional regulator with XRE-family HTH domain
MTSPNPSPSCSNCESPARVVRGLYRFQESGLSNHFLDIEMIHCDKCGNDDPIIPQLNEFMSILALAVVKKPCPLNGEEIRFLRKFLKMTGERFGQYLGVSKHHISKLENNADPVGAQTDRLIRALTVCLGENLKGHIQEIGNLLPDIEETIRVLECIVDPEAESVSYR